MLARYRHLLITNSMLIITNIELIDSNFLFSWELMYFDYGMKNQFFGYWCPSGSSNEEKHFKDNMYFHHSSNS